MVAIRNETDSVWTAAARSLSQFRQRSAQENADAALDSSLLTDFIEASRRADSFTEVLQVSLEDLRAKLSARSALLLEKVRGAQYDCVAASPPAAYERFDIADSAFC